VALVNRLSATASLLLLFVASALSGAAIAQTPPPAKADDSETTPAQKQRASIEAMRASIEKQKAAVRTQVKTNAPAVPFFTSAWQDPAARISPTLIVPPACDPMPKSQLEPLIAETAQAEGVDPELIRSVVRHESAAYPCIISLRGAIGLMQLMPATAQQFGVDPMDPKQNMQAGARYLKQLLARYNGDTRLALAAYNAGPGRVDATGGVPPIPETTNYVDAIMADLDSSKTPAPSDPATDPSTNQK
jgi:soluble lytic murein transglycosylase-like protein